MKMSILMGRFEAVNLDGRITGCDGVSDSRRCHVYVALLTFIPPGHEIVYSVYSSYFLEIGSWHTFANWGS